MKQLNAKAFLCALLCSCSAGTVSLGSIEEFSFTATQSSLFLNENSTITISGGVAPYTINSTLHPELWTQNSSNSFSFNYNIWEEKNLPFQIIDGIGQILNTSFTLLPSAYNFSGGSNSTSTPKDFVIDSNSDLIVAGETNGRLADQRGISGISDSYLSKIKQNGKHEWSIQIGAGTGTSTYIQKVGISSSNEIIILGYTDGDLHTLTPFGTLYGTPGGSLDPFIMKLSPLGDPIWTSQLGSGVSATPISLNISGSDDIIISGQTEGDFYSHLDFNGILYGTEVPNNQDAFVMKISGTNGTPTWTSQLDSGATTIPVSLITSGSNIILSGHTLGGDLHSHGDFNGLRYGGNGSPLESGNEDAFVMKIVEGTTPEPDPKPFGPPMWTSQFEGGASYVRPVSLSISGSDIILSGYTDGDLYTPPEPPALDFNGTLYGTESLNNIDAFVMKISDSGVPTWTSQFNGGVSYILPVSLSISGSDIILSGYTDGDLYTTPPPPSLDFYGTLYGTEVLNNQDAFVMKIVESTSPGPDPKPFGPPMWTSQFEGGASYVRPVSLSISNSDIILSGYTDGDLYTNPIFNGALYGSEGDTDLFVIKIQDNTVAPPLRSSGPPSWTSQLGTAAAILSTQSLDISDDFIYVFGKSSGTAHLPGTANTTLGSTNSFLVKINSDGAQQ